MFALRGCCGEFSGYDQGAAEAGDCVLDYLKDWFKAVTDCYSPWSYCSNNRSDLDWERDLDAEILRGDGYCAE